MDLVPKHRSFRNVTKWALIKNGNTKNRYVNKFILRLNCDSSKLSLICIQQNETPIYNMAAGTCLHVREAKIGATVELALCSEKTNNKWDLVAQ